MTAVPLTLDHALTIASDLRPWDREEIAASCGHSDFAAWARQLTALPRLEATVILHDGEAVAMGGAAINITGDTAVTWFVARPTLTKVAREAHLLALRMHRDLSTRVRQCLAFSLNGHQPGRKWLDRLGYEPHGGMIIHGREFTLMQKVCHV